MSAAESEAGTPASRTREIMKQAEIVAEDEDLSPEVRMQAREVYVSSEVLIKRLEGDDGGD